MAGSAERPISLEDDEESEEEESMYAEPSEDIPDRAEENPVPIPVQVEDPSNVTDLPEYQPVRTGQRASRRFKTKHPNAMRPGVQRRVVGGSREYPSVTERRERAAGYAARAGIEPELSSDGEGSNFIDPESGKGSGSRSPARSIRSSTAREKLARLGHVEYGCWEGGGCR